MGVVAWLPLQAQGIADSSATAAAYSGMHARYLESVGQQSLLYNGPQYVNYAVNTKGHQFLATDQEQKGSVVYEGYEFLNLPLWYDIKLDALITASSGALVKQRLVSEKVSSFVIGGRRFVRIDAKKALGSPVGTGFYEVLFTDKARLQVLARHIKRLQPSPNPGDIQKIFIPDDAFFVVRDGVYHPVGSQGSVLALFKEHKKPLRQYARTQKLKFKKDTRSASLAQLVAHYAQLTAGTTPAQAPAGR